MNNSGALIIDGHGHADLGVIRALGQKGVPVYLATDSPRRPLCSSQYITRVFNFPQVSAPDSLKRERLIEIEKELPNKTVFFATGDTSLLFASRNRDILQGKLCHHLGESDIIENCYNKSKFAQLAQVNNLPVPFTVLPSNVERLRESLSLLKFSVILKAADRHLWANNTQILSIVKNIKGIKVETHAGLLTLYKDISCYDQEIIIQEYVEGLDDCHIDLHVYVNREKKYVNWFTGQKIRIYPIHEGSGCFVVSRIDKEVAGVGLEVLRKLNYSGHANMNFKRDDRTKEIKLLEINCRYSLWNYLSTAAGVNLPYIAYLDSIDQKFDTIPLQKEGIRWINFRNDLKAFLQYRRCGEWSLGRWLVSYIGRNCYSVFDWKDLMPFIKMGYNRCRRVIQYK